MLLLLVVGKQKTKSYHLIIVEIKFDHWWMFAINFIISSFRRKWFPKAFNFCFVLFCIVSEVLMMILLVFASE